MPSQEEDLRRRLHQTAQVLNDTLVDLQEISRGLHPAMLAKGGLEPALTASSGVLTPHAGRGSSA